MRLLLNLLPHLQNDEPTIVRYWEAFAEVVNGFVLQVYYFFVDIYPWGWFYILLLFWMSIMLFWMKELPEALATVYYVIFFAYLLVLPYLLVYYA